jgi:A/G-specific adenine glycosylase
LRDEDFSPVLLAWYDAHARELPWRIGPIVRTGQAPNPYFIWLSEVMLQQTTVAAVTGYFRKFIDRWPTVTALAEADDADVMAAWAGLGYYARARNLLKCARVVAGDHGGCFPDTEAELLYLPGIGPYTAAAIAAIAFDRRATVMDGNVERVMARLFKVETPLPTAKPVLKAHAHALTPAHRPGDHAQAVMDLGATICTPRNPACGICPLRDGCRARAAGIAGELPRKSPKKPKPIRHGIAYLARRTDGAWLLETRPEKGLLGGMLGWPTTAWSESAPAPAPPLPVIWHDPSLEVLHSFTHFHLRLSLRLATLPADTQGQFIPDTDFRPADLPTVMRKAFDLAQGAFIQD